MSVPASYRWDRGDSGIKGMRRKRPSDDRDPDEALLPFNGCASVWMGNRGVTKQ
jgi:hypothetical protein